MNNKKNKINTIAEEPKEETNYKVFIEKPSETDSLKSDDSLDAMEPISLNKPTAHNKESQEQEHKVLTSSLKIDEV